MFFLGEVGAHGVRIATLEAAKGPTEIENIRGNVQFCSCEALETP